MSEPRATAVAVEPVVPGIWRWGVRDDRIAFRSDAYAVGAQGEAVLIDPLPLAEEALDSLGPVRAICLTAGNHQRAAWRLREALGVPVLVPREAHGLEGEPDAEYAPGDALPGGLRALDGAGPAFVHCALWLESRRALFLGDLLCREADEGLAFVPSKHQDDPAGSRQSVGRLLELPVEVVCPSHGLPVTERGAEAMAEALRAGGAG